MPITGDLGAGNFLASQVVEGVLNVDPEESTNIAKSQVLTSLESQKKSLEDAKLSLEVIQSLSNVNQWPQRESGNAGFLPLGLLQPSLTVSPSPTSPRTNTLQNFNYEVEVIKGGIGDYKFKDWRGQILQDEESFPKKTISTEDRFKASNKLPKSNSEVMESPHSMRDVPLIFGDTRTDYFKFGLQTIDNLTPIENPETGASTLRKDLFTATPWEQNEPIYYGFDIIFDSVSSPLLNGSINDFINNYAGINEVFNRKRVYEEFKNQFVKFFRTNARVRIDTNQLSMTSTTTNVANLDGPSSLSNQQKGTAYFAHYIKSITGLDLLIEKNKGQVYSWAPKYKEDMIEIKMAEDVTLSLSTLAHLYKLLYWSRPQGKHLIPENLLRFNCQIIISEVRNLQRVRKDVASGNIEVLKDNLSRWVYNLRECQFFFDKMPVPNEIDMSQEVKDFEGQSISFDFKYSTQKLERFVPDGQGWGKYVAYDAGAIWKIGNAGARSSRSSGSSPESSVPAFYTDNFVPKGENGIEKPYVIAMYGDATKVDRLRSSVTSLDLFKSQSTKASENQQAQSAAENATDNQATLKTTNAALSFISSSQIKKAKDFLADVTGINKYSTVTQITSSVRNSGFFDVKGQLVGNNPLNPQKNLINNTIDKLYNYVPGPYDGANAAGGGKINIFDRNVSLNSFTENKLGKDAMMGKYTYAGEGPNSKLGYGSLSNGYRPPVPMRAKENALAGPNPQANITYIPAIGSNSLRGYNPPIQRSFNRSRGSDPAGNLYVLQGQVSNFAGQPVSNQIFGSNGQAPEKRG